VGLGRLGIDPVDQFGSGRAEPWGDDSIRTAGRNRIVAFANIVSAVSCDAAYFLVCLFLDPAESG
jgi:hypothetical protein